MTRCIHCTRCIRFAADVAGVPDLGGTGRGENMEVGTYVEKALTSELSGNMIDLCPVGALTSKPYAFEARAWELRKTESVDVLDAVGTNIRLDARGQAVLRILPRVNEDVNEEWLSDKGRFAVDGLLKRRLDRPYIRRHGKLVEASWPDALTAVAERLGKTAPERIAAIAGDLCCVESMLALKEVMVSLGVTSLDCRQDGAKTPASARSSYLFNSTIAGIDKADVVLLIGTNPRQEAPVINARLGTRWVAEAIGCRIAFGLARAGQPPPGQRRRATRSKQKRLTLLLATWRGPFWRTADSERSMRGASWRSRRCRTAQA